MTMKGYGIKAARDKCKTNPEEHKAYLQRGGQDYNIIVCPPELRSLVLVAKLHEEAEEIRDDLTNPEEYADLLQVVLDLAAENGVRNQDISDVMDAKRICKGGFREGKIAVRMPHRRNVYGEKECEHGRSYLTGCNPCGRRIGTFDKNGNPIKGDLLFSNSINFRGEQPYDHLACTCATDGPEGCNHCMSPPPDYFHLGVEAEHMNHPKVG